MPLVEAILDENASRLIFEEGASAAALVADCAVWICACVTHEVAPCWLIWGDPDTRRVHWCRVPDDSEVADVVSARKLAGGHTDPGSVLAWLKGKDSDPWSGGDGWGDPTAIDELANGIRGV